MYYEYVLRCVCRRATRCRFSSVRGVLFLHCDDAELGNHHRHRTIIYALRTSCLFASPSYSFSADSPCACGKNTSAAGCSHRTFSILRALHQVASAGCWPPTLLPTPLGAGRSAAFERISSLVSYVTQTHHAASECQK